MKILKTNILTAFIGAISFSAFIYLSHFDINFKLLHTLFAVVGFYIFIHSDKKTLFYFGFFVGVFWFYWISLSFRYYDLSFFIPIVIIGIGLIYGVFFYLIGYVSYYMRFIAIFLLEYVYIFDFNYLNAKLVLVNSYIPTDNISFVVFLLLLSFVVKIYKYNKKLSIIYIFTGMFALYYLSSNAILIKPDIDIQLVHTDINQADKYKFENINSYYQHNFTDIQKAILEKKDAIVFPESAFEIPLNTDFYTLNKLKTYSKHITIIANSLYVEKNKKYNSTYVFTNEKMQIIHKYILTPFGERVPFAKFITDIVNNIFFDGSDDFSRAKSYGEYKIKNYTFRNAICYEATRDEIYKNNPKYIIAMSNNAWFAPSIQSTLQNIYLRYMSKKYKVVIYHSSNRGFNDVIQ